MAYFMLQKRPDDQTGWRDVEGEAYRFAKSLPNARRVSKRDKVVFYRPVGCGTLEDGCVYASAAIGPVTIERDGTVEAHIHDFHFFERPVPLTEVGDPRANVQHSLQPISEEYFLNVLKRAAD
jgi:hypothetical protein